MHDPLIFDRWAIVRVALTAHLDRVQLEAADLDRIPKCEAMHLNNPKCSVEATAWVHYRCRGKGHLVCHEWADQLKIRLEQNPVRACADCLGRVADCWRVIPL